MDSSKRKQIHAFAKTNSVGFKESLNYLKDHAR